MSELCGKSSAADIVLVCGDFNQPRIVWTHGQDGSRHTSSSQLPAASAALVDGMDFLNLSQVNQEINHLGRSLDLIFCSPDQECLIDRCVAPLVTVDIHHPPLTLSMPINRNHTANLLIPKDTRALNYRKINFTALIEYLQNVDWTTLLAANDVDNSARLFSEASQVTTQQ